MAIKVMTGEKITPPEPDYVPIGIYNIGIFRTRNSTSLPKYEDSWYIANVVVDIRDTTHDEPPVCNLPAYVKVILTVIMVASHWKLF